MLRIMQLQNAEGRCVADRLQLSKADEFFPGTNDRVLLISGSLDVVSTASACRAHCLTRHDARSSLPCQPAPCCQSPEAEVTMLVQVMAGLQSVLDAIQEEEASACAVNESCHDQLE